MRFHLIVIGKARQGPERTLFDHYHQRLRWPLTVSEHEVKKNLTHVEARQAAEATLIENAIPKGAVIVALDERGKNLSSRDWSQQINQWQDSSERDVALIIGGADGLAPTIRQQARLLLSYGKATWPHMLVRALVAEQLYRAHTILDGHPYHRE